ncbi:MAG TPA: serine hydrolase domain-containing protein [Polyangiaceae bacterium]|jgi:CubicO group peptidase (beta-lactamase class C family)
MRDKEMDLVAERLVVEPEVAPVAAVAIAFRGDKTWFYRTGRAARRSTRRTGTAADVFDLASLTKPFVALCCARLSGGLPEGLACRLDRLLPELAGTSVGGATLELLLAHRAGLKAHLPLFAPLVARRAINRRSTLHTAIGWTRSGCDGAVPSEGFPPLYSDLGFFLIGEALETWKRRPLDELVDEEVSRPLELEAYSARQWLSRGDFLARVAPTEHVGWRGGELLGVAHDENAWALAGHRSAGHAGLFATAEAMARFGAALLDALAGRAESWLRRELLSLLLAPRSGGSLRAGFDGKAAADSAAGRLAGPDTFGHLGFTGTSFWCDPRRETVTVLLTNRVNPSRTRQAIAKARPKVHDALFELAEVSRS